MAFPSPPLTFSCRACNWKQTFPFQISDCRIPGLNHFTTCPRCGSAVESHRANPLELLAAKIRHTFGKRRQR